MVGAKFGQILALVGLFVLVLSGLGGRRRRASLSRETGRWRGQRWGHLVGLALVLVGLLVMWAEK